MSDLINPTDYGVLVTGFSRMRLPEIRQAIITDLQTRTGLTFETRPDSITGQFIDVFAEREATVWELAEAVYHAMYPISAFGVNLDHAVSFAGVTRLFAQQSLVQLTLYGDQGTVIPAGSLVRSNANQQDFVLLADVTIDALNAGDVTFSVDSAIVGQEYWITIDAFTARYTAVIGDTSTSIAGHLVSDLLLTGKQVTQDANLIRVYTDQGTSFNTAHSTNISMTQLSSLGQAQATDYGPITVAAHTVNQIQTTLIGWDAVDNLFDGQIGRDTETDDELRQRYNRGVYRLGGGTVDSIRANIEQNVIGVSNVMVYENVNDYVDADGRPPHSIEVVATGGDPQAIAQQIYNYKAAGIDTFGSIVVSVTDSSGYAHNIHFNRPLPVFAWVNVTVDLYNEEIFPANGDKQIQDIVTATGNTFGPGKDIIVQRFYGPIYSGVAGIGKLTVAVAITGDDSVPPLSYSSDNIPIAVRQVAIFNADRVSVTINS